MDRIDEGLRNTQGSVDIYGTRDVLKVRDQLLEMGIFTKLKVEDAPERTYLRCELYWLEIEAGDEDPDAPPEKKLNVWLDVQSRLTPDALVPKLQEIAKHLRRYGYIVTADEYPD